jgi:hypothetical protein
MTNQSDESSIQDNTSKINFVGLKNVLKNHGDCDTCGGNNVTTEAKVSIDYNMF